ncbi:hypothetical protein NPIL_347611 [Nephila pilipes]|uniref:Uncharacterized protein n=1 Tax=Nephila pilipes TaxID=299642 RepID=A0A8X6MFR4_NEPPI|nr:hypothetical protein NPIL_347611 [Nephila pilipes]
MVISIYLTPWIFNTILYFASRSPYCLKDVFDSRRCQKKVINVKYRLQKNVTPPSYLPCRSSSVEMSPTLCKHHPVRKGQKRNRKLRQTYFLEGNAVANFRVRGTYSRSLSGDTSDGGRQESLLLADALSHSHLGNLSCH